MTSFYGASRLDRPFQKERPETHEEVSSRRFITSESFAGSSCIGNASLNSDADPNQKMIFTAGLK